MEDEKKEPQYGRPKKESAEGRVKYSTVLQPHLIKFLKMYAAETEQSPADVLEVAVSALKEQKERNK